MTITSIDYLIFCIFAILLFICFPKKYRWISLLISSGVFYWISAKGLIVYILLTTFTTWMAANIIDRYEKAAALSLSVEGITIEEKKRIKGECTKSKKRILVSTLVLNIGILVFFKAFNYFSGAFTALGQLMFGRESVVLDSIVTPLGISYYTFITVGYLLDIYWKRYSKEDNFFRFLLFSAYFPHILQGPISRYPKLGQELKKPELHVKWDNFVVGSEYVLLGCFKKLVLADRLGVFVAKTYKTPGLDGFIYIMAIVFDAIQIYMDFSGYTDIVRGISYMFDVELEQNFNHPFFSKSVPEFWRRWHMSLGSWFKDYVYYPVNMSKTVKSFNKKLKTCKSPKLKSMLTVVIPVMVTWILTGLWHGTGAGYLCWGIYYGILITLSVTFSDGIESFYQKHSINTESLFHRMLQTIKIFIIFMGGRFLGNTMGMGQRVEIFKNIFVNFGSSMISSYGLTKDDFAIILLGLIIMIIIAIIEEKENIMTWFNKRNKLFCLIVILFFGFSIFLLGIYGSGYSTAGFMYQQF